MILQALYEYYQRKAADPESGIAPQGFEWKEFPFVVVIDMQGNFVALEDTREGEGKNRRAKKFLVPKSIPRTGSKSYATSNLLWDHVGYVFGQAKSELEKDVVLAGNQHSTWLNTLSELNTALNQVPEIKALNDFYTKNQNELVKDHSLWTDCIKNNGTNITFRIDGQNDLIPCLQQVADLVRSRVAAESTVHEDEDEGENPQADSSKLALRCLITGELGEIARTHTKTPINKDCKSFVGIQKNSGYDSYGKEQAYNSPVSKKAEFAYSTALLSMLAKDSKNKINIADTTTVFWSQKKTQLESDFPFFWNTKDNPDKCIQVVESLLKSPFTGSAIAEDKTQFYVLGLAPGGGSRISVRFWKTGSVAEFSKNIRQHFLDLEIVKPTFSKDNLALFLLLKDIAVLGESENIPPNLSGNVVQSILTGGAYPITLLQQTVRRIRAQQPDEKHGVRFTQASVLKAVLNRQRRFQMNPPRRRLKWHLM